MGDPQELNSIAQALCASRQDPLLIGSIKSNMGHPEPASGLAALAKVGGQSAPSAGGGQPHGLSWEGLVTEGGHPGHSHVPLPWLSGAAFVETRCC